MAKAETTKRKTASFTVERGVVTTGYLKDPVEGRVTQQVLKHHRVGETVELDPDEGAELIALGIVSDPTKVEPPPPPAPANAAPKEGVTITQDTKKGSTGKTAPAATTAPAPAPAASADEA